VALQQIVEQTVTGLGYDLVEIERSAGGLLRVTIDLPWQPPVEGEPVLPEQFVTVEDCEKVTRQLQFALEVDGVDYTRLEVSSPGIDRPLRHEQDFIRFTGEVIDLTLKEPMGAAAGGQVSANRKNFRGTL
jgi:ribosome maturation factor RimP